jgi:hypothetical protein
MQFRKKPLSSALFASLGVLAAAPALALGPNSYAPGSTLDVYLSGSSAQDNGLRAVIARICATGTLDRYDYGSNQAAFLCTPAASLGLSSTIPSIAIYKSSVAGSGNGVLPLRGTGTPLAFLSFTAINANAGSCGTTSTVAAVTVAGDTLGVPAYVARTCNTALALATTSVRPDGGLSDVEPPIFTTRDTTSITAASANSVTFGIAVSKNLYRALQRAQGLDATTTSADVNNVSSVTGIASLPVNDNEANMPSLTRDTIATLFSGQYVTWDKLQVLVNSSTAAALTTFSGSDTTVAAAPTSTNVYIARRVPSSGTQKGSEIFLFGGTAGGDDDGLGLNNAYPASCNPTALPMANSPNNPSADLASVCQATAAPAQKVFNGSGSGDVRNCLSAHATNGRWAIGILSTESAYAAGNNWRFIKVDGASPSLLNVYTNRYKNWVSQSVNKPAYFDSLSLAKQSVVNTLFTNLSNQTVLRAVNATLAQPFGAGSLFALVENGANPDPLPVTQSQIQANPGLPLTRAFSGTTDNCQLPQYGTNPSTNFIYPNQIN